MAHFLMCPPTYFSIDYVINPWMDTSRPTDRDLAQRQWDSLLNELTSISDVKVDLIEPQEGLPDLVFTANAGVVKDGLFISSNFRHLERQPETPIYEKWFTEHGYKVKRLPAGLQFEGQGDMLRAGGTWYGGYYFRTDPQALASISELLEEQVIPLRLVNERHYHLDTCFCPLDDSIIYYPDAFDEYSDAVLTEHFPGALQVTREEAAGFACNSIVVGRSIITNYAGDRMTAALSVRGFEVLRVNLSEFIKAGGSAKCLVMRLD